MKLFHHTHLSKRLLLSCLIFIFSLNFNTAVNATDLIQAGRYYEKAKSFHRTNDFKSAVIELKNALQQNPDYLAAQILLTEIYLKQNNLISAEISLDKADNLGADPSLMLKNRVQLFMKQLRYSDVIKLDPQPFSVNLKTYLHTKKGDAYVELNQLGYALNEYDAAASLNPNSSKPVTGRANVQLRLGNIPAAIEETKRAAELNPDSADIWYMKASINLAQGQLELAVTELNEAIKIEPDHFNARLARIGILMDLKKDEEARIDLKHLRKNFPLDAKTAYLHAVLLDRNNEKEKSLAELRAAVDQLDSLKPEVIEKHSQSLMLAGLINYSLKRFEKAIYYLAIYTRQNPGQPGPSKLLASILLDKKDNESVIKLLRPLISGSPADYRLHLLLSRAYMQNGQHDLANTLLEKVAALNTDDAEVNTEMGLNRLAIGKEKLAIENLRTAFKSDPGNLKAGVPLTMIYISKEDFEKAIAIAKKMQVKLPDNLTVLNLLATTQAKAGQTETAQANFLKAIEIDPDFITAYINLSKLDLLKNEYNNARQRLINLLEKYPEKIALYIEIAKIFEVEQDYSNAAEWYKKATALNSKSLTPKLALIELKLKSGESSEALRLAQLAEQKNRDNMQVLDVLARSFIATDNIGKAIGVLNKMSINAGFNAKQLLNIANMQIYVGDHKSAIRSLKNAIIGSENYIPARTALGEAELQFGNLIFAKNHSQFLIERFPENESGYRLAGDIALREEKRELAVSSYQKAFDLEASEFNLMNLYQALKYNQQNKIAFQNIKRWVEKAPQSILPKLALAEDYLRQQNYDNAEKYYEQLLNAVGEKADLLNNLAHIYFIKGNDKALEYAEKAQQLDSEKASTNDTLGWILVNQGKPELGMQYLQNAYARASQNPEIIYHIGYAYYQLKQYDDAASELKAALDLASEFPGHKHAKKLLQQIKSR